MKRILLLTIIFLGMIYSLPFINGERKFEDIDLSFVSDFSLNFNHKIQENEKICVNIQGENVDINIDDFLCGVLASEMPASFDIEALKAQAVAGRTYIYYKNDLILKGIDDGKHVGAVVCDDYNHCKSYINLENQNPWGERYDEYYAKISQAVLETSGEYIAYLNEPIASVFHSTSSGNTESAKDVWGSDIPYLQAVTCEGSLSSPKYEENFSFTYENFKTIILKNYPDIIFSTDKNSWFNSSVRSDSGGIISVILCGQEISGIHLREMLSLNSTNFTVVYEENSIVFTTKGYGHGVGLSQYGANSLALNGLDYKEILTHYYQGTNIQKIY